MGVAARQLVVLIVDDDPGDVLLIQDALEVAGHARSIHVATDGYETVEFLRRSGEYAGAPRPDLVLLDLNMPRKDGRQVLAEIKTDALLSTTPILVFTTSQNPDDIAAIYSLRANAYVSKPIHLDDFTAVVGRIDEFFSQVVVLPTAS